MFVQLIMEWFLSFHFSYIFFNKKNLFSKTFSYSIFPSFQLALFHHLHSFIVELIPSNHFGHPWVWAHSKRVGC